MTLKTRAVSWGRPPPPPLSRQPPPPAHRVSRRLSRPQVTPTLQPGLENKDAPSWLEEPIRHVVKSQQFNRESLEHVLRVAREMENVRPGSDASRQLQGAIMSTLFYEPSTRTRLSFESAMARLGGTILTTESAAEFSSAAKGETLEGARLRLRLVAAALRCGSDEGRGTAPTAPAVGHVH